MKLRGNVDESGEGVFIFCIKFWVWVVFNKFYCKNRLKAICFPIYIIFSMPKSSSPAKAVDPATTSAKARFFYTGVFAMLKRKE